MIFRSFHHVLRQTHAEHAQVKSRHTTGKWDAESTDLSQLHYYPNSRNLLDSYKLLNLNPLQNPGQLILHYQVLTFYDAPWIPEFEDYHVSMDSIPNSLQFPQIEGQNSAMEVYHFSHQQNWNRLSNEGNCGLGQVDKLSAF